MRKDREISVTHVPELALAFDVVVRDGRARAVTRDDLGGDTARFRELGLDPAGCVEAAMAFLLDREPKESILGAFDISRHSTLLSRIR